MERPQAWWHDAARSPSPVGFGPMAPPLATPRTKDGQGSRRKIHSRCPAGEWGSRREGELPGKPWKSGRPGAPPALSEMPIRPELPDRIPPGQPRARSPPTLASTPASAMTPLPPAVPPAVPPSFRHARTPGRGKPTPPERSRATRPRAPPDAAAGRSGDDGAVSTAEAASKYEPGQKTVRGTVFPANGCLV